MLADQVEVLIEQYGTDIYRFCSRLCRNRADAEDLYQKTFLKVLELSVEVNRDGNPKAFLFSVTNGLWMNEVRKMARHSRIAPSVSLDDDNENLAAEQVDLESEVLARIRDGVLRKIMEELPEKFRIPVILYYTCEVSLEEIGKIMKKPTGTIKSRLHKARSIIKKRLEEQGYEYAG